MKIWKANELRRQNFQPGFHERRKDEHKSSYFTIKTGSTQARAQGSNFLPILVHALVLASLVKTTSFSILNLPVFKPLTVM